MVANGVGAVAVVVMVWCEGGFRRRIGGVDEVHFTFAIRGEFGDRGIAI